MTELNVSHRSLVLFQAILTFRRRQEELAAFAGSNAAFAARTDERLAAAESLKARQAAMSNFEWPSEEKQPKGVTVPTLNSWVQLYSALTELDDEAATRNLVVESVRNIVAYEKQLLTLSARLCEIDYQDEELKGLRIEVKEQVEDFYASLGQRFDAMIWTNKHHAERCTKCQQKAAKHKKSTLQLVRHKLRSRLGV